MTVSAQKIFSPSRAAVRQPLRVALGGYGIVGQALVQQLLERPEFELVSILVRHPDRPRAVAAPLPLTDDPKAFFSAPCDIFVDALSCERTGALLSELALAAGTHVVSASKRVISGSHAQLKAAAERSGARLLYSASVGGGAPVLETIATARARSEVRSVAGILNGTVNYILDRLARGATFPQALAEARLAGFAEEDPSEDLSGADAAAKLKLIAHEAFGIDPADLQVRTEPLDAAAVARIQESGQRWIQLARLDRTGKHISASVSLRPRQDVESLPHVDDEWNCIAATFADGTFVRCLGPGAGGIATAGSIIADLALLAAEAEASAEVSSAC